MHETIDAEQREAHRKAKARERQRRYAARKAAQERRNPKERPGARKASMSSLRNHKPGTPLPPEIKRRCAEIIGGGLTHIEAAGALGISARSVDKIMSDPEYRKIAEDIRRKKGSTRASAASVIVDLLNATLPSGAPDHAKRKQGAELYIRDPSLLDEVEDVDDEMLPGVRKSTLLVFPFRGRQPTPLEPPVNPNAPVTFSEDDLAQSFHRPD